MEGSFGPSIDTAPRLRAASAMGLVHMNHPDAVVEIVTLLVDREADARVGAVRSLGLFRAARIRAVSSSQGVAADPSVR